MLPILEIYVLHQLLQGSFKYQPGQVRAFGMLAGGSGITPMYQVMKQTFLLQHIFPYSWNLGSILLFHCLLSCFKNKTKLSHFYFCSRLLGLY